VLSSYYPLLHARWGVMKHLFLSLLFPCQEEEEEEELEDLFK
jgi:hypothetical protein